jgi:non-ribosomal peptide synthetase component E (peptide arylation enzyme)
MEKVKRETKEIEEYTRLGYWGTFAYHDYLERNAREFPDREALVDSRQRVTFKELRTAASTLAVAFEDMQIGKGNVVGLQTPNCCEYFVGRYALSKMGAISLSLTMNLRKMELQHVFRYTKPDAIITYSTIKDFDLCSMHEELSTETGYPKIIIVANQESHQNHMTLRSIQKKYGGKSAAEKESLGDASQVDAIGLTSGTTTGIPKLIRFTPNMRFYTAGQIIKQNKITSEDVILLLSPLTQGIGNLVGLTVSGMSAAKVVLGAQWDPETCISLIETEKPTIIEAVPAQLSKLISLNRFERLDFGSLRFIISAGAALPESVAKYLMECTGAKLINVYGAHDGGIASITSIDVEDEDICRTVGRPLPGMNVKIVDEIGNELPVESVGEVIYCGPGSPQVYHIDGIVQKAVDDEGFYHSGDLGMIDGKGYLKIVGRLKDLIIRGGQNVDPKLTEGILARHPKISEITIVGMPDKVLGEKICAYVVPKSNEVVSLDEIVSFLRRESIAVYNFPERIEMVAELPVSGGGKIMKEKLRADITEKLRHEGIINE